MKFSTIAAVAASAALVSASPLRVVVVSTSNSVEAIPGGPLRFGHAVAAAGGVRDPVARVMTHVPGQAPDARPRRRPCPGRPSRFRQKAIELSNSFRKAFGLPLIETSHPHHDGTKSLHGGVIQIMPFIPHGPHTGTQVEPIRVIPFNPNGGAPTMARIEGAMPGNVGWMGRTKGGERVNFIPRPLPMEEGITVPVHPHPHGFHRHGYDHPMDVRDEPFLLRVQNAILSLGPWEGRAVAFVLGCGLGVLLRMFWVLAVVTYRAVRGGSEEEHEYEQVVIFDDDATLISAPPAYVYPVDEKVVEDADAAPALPEPTNN